MEPKIKRRWAKNPNREEKQVDEREAPITIVGVLKER